jgi:hypothetical protein
MFVASLVLSLLAILGGALGWSLLLGIRLPLLSTVPYVLPGAGGVLLAAAAFGLSFATQGKPGKTARVLSSAALGVDGLLVLGKLIGCPATAGLVLVTLCIGILALYHRFVRRCPECGSLKTREAGKTEVPGTERTQPTGPRGPAATPTNVYAKYHIRYQCQSCGHRWQREEERHKRTY